MRIRTPYFQLILMALFIIIGRKPASAQIVCDTTFFKEYFGNGHVEPFATKNSSNNEILIAGSATESNGSIYKAMAVKLSASGSVLWSVLVGGSIEDRFTGIEELSDNSYLFYGTTKSFGNPNGKILLVHISNTGTVLSSRQFGTSSPATERLYELKQFTDGDLIGIYNINDSTSQSDPVVFKMSIDGTLRWARRFDNSSEEGFNSFAIEGNNIYLSGFYRQTLKRGVLTVANANTGAIVSAKNLFFKDGSYDQVLDQLQIINNKLSYGLWVRKNGGNYPLSKIVLIQSDLSGTNKTFETLVDISGDSSRILFKQTPDKGFLFLRNSWQPEVVKLNTFNQIEWSTVQRKLNYSFNQKNPGFDVTAAGGSVSAGYYSTYMSGNINRMLIMKVNAMGEIGDCTLGGSTFFRDTVTIVENSFSWAFSSLINPEINEVVATAIPIFTLQQVGVCEKNYCIDLTPLPAGCNKTFVTEYASLQRSIIRDAVSTTDGGRVAVGSMYNNGWIIKYNNDGEVAWSKQVDEFSHNIQFLRIVRATDGNLFALANDDWTVNHGGSRQIKLIKLDNNGNILSTKNIIRGPSTEIGDIAPSPDGGFVILINEHYGSGYLYSGVIRFDASFNVVWKKEIKHFNLAPIYRSIFCTTTGVYFGHDAYDSYNQESIGIQKLDYATGNDSWSKRLLIANNNVRLNKILVSNDTVYAFVNKSPLPNTGTQMMMLKLNDAGDLLTSLQLVGDNILPPYTYYYFDVARPTVTLTPEHDFIMSNQVQSAAGSAINFTQFDKNGVSKWSKNYPGLDGYCVYNIHQQGSGALILGTIKRPRPGAPQFTTTFMMKVDSNGIVSPAASGLCGTEDRPLLSPLQITVTNIDSRIDSVVNLSDLIITNSTVKEIPRAIDAILYCNVKTGCLPVTLGVIGSGCDLQEPLIYYLNNNNCGAVASWKFNTDYFQLISSSSDTLKIKPKRSGTSQVIAEVEDDCTVKIFTETASVLLSASLLDLGADTTICPSASITLRAGPGYSNYLWNNASTDSLLVINSSGTYYVTVTDFCGGSATDTIHINNAGIGFEIAGLTEKCNKDTVTLVATAGYINYIWTASSTLVATGNIAKVNPLITTEYYVEAEKIPGCVVRDTLLLTVKTSPSINLGKDTSICYNKSVQLSAPPGFNNYLWNNVQGGVNLLVSDTGKYILSAIYSNNCVSVDTVEVFKYPFVKPNLGKDTAICKNSGFNLNAGNYASYSWNTQSSNIRLLPVNVVGEYSVQVTDQFGCTGGDSIRILEIYESPVNFLDDSVGICFGENVLLSPTINSSSSTWSNGSTTRNITVNELGNYSLSLTNNNGCTGKDTIAVVRKLECPTSVYFPTGFTPDNNGRNDIFKPLVYTQLEKYSFVVYSRWGQIIFKSTDPEKGWDGKWNGQLQDSNMFIWVCNYKSTGQPEKVEKGTVMLIR